MKNSVSSVSKVHLNSYFWITFKAISGIEQEQGQKQAEECASINEILYFQNIFSYILFLGKQEMF